MARLTGWMAALCCVCILLGCSGERVAVERPNVVLISIDTLRADHTSLHGYPLPTTPRLEAIGSEGAAFRAAYAPIATTGPSHASIFTGLYPIGHGVVWNGMALSEEHATLAEVLAQAGYRTAGVVSSFPLDRSWGYAQGFEQYVDEFAPSTSSVTIREWNGRRLEGGFDRRANATTDLAIEWLEEADDEQPFFLFVHYFDPHGPYAPPASFPRTLSRKRGDALSEAIALYDEEILFTDREVGRLVDALAERSLDQRTLLVITADHGEGLMDHGHLEHGIHVYEEAVRVPLIFRWPGRIAPGRAPEEPVELVDLMPTILDLIGVESEGVGQGRSLADFLVDDAPLDPGRAVFLHRRRYEPQTISGHAVAGERWALRRGDWKLIAANEVESPELYNLAVDPRELTNVIGYHPDRAAEMQAEIDAWKRAHRRTPSAPTNHPLSEEDRAKLEALGYVE